MADLILENSLLLDRLAIQNLYSAYCFALDRNDLEPYLACFTDDAVVDIGGLGVYRGREELSTIITGSGATRARHQYLNLLFAEQGDGVAHCAAYFQLLSKSGIVSAYGEYDDDVVRCADGQWRWRSRKIVYLWKHDTYSYGR